MKGWKKIKENIWKLQNDLSLSLFRTYGIQGFCETEEQPKSVKESYVLLKSERLLITFFIA